MAAGTGAKARTSTGRGAVPVCTEPSEAGSAFVGQMLEATRQLLPLPAWLARYPLALTSPSARQALWARGRSITRNEDIGFAVAERVSLEFATGPLWRLFQTAPTVRAFLDSYPHWQTLLFDFVEFSYVGQAERVWVRGIPPHGIVVDRGEQDCRTALFVDILRALHKREDMALLAVNFSYPRPDSVRRHQSVLGTHVLSFSQPIGQLAFARALLDAPLPGADAEEFARLHVAASEAARVEARSVAARADETATWLLAAPGATAQAVARQLGMSVRTLRRRLAEEGRSFRELIDGVRQRELQLFLETGVYTMKQLALRVGFANDRALRHALRRWQTRKG